MFALMFMVFWFAKHLFSCTNSFDFSLKILKYEISVATRTKHLRIHSDLHCINSQFKFSITLASYWILMYIKLHWATIFERCILIFLLKIMLINNENMFCIKFDQRLSFPYKIKTHSGLYCCVSVKVLLHILPKMLRYFKSPRDSLIWKVNHFFFNFNWVHL